MSYRISILDKSPLAAGETAAQALARTLTLAQQAEAWGYHRFCYTCSNCLVVN